MAITRDLSGNNPTTPSPEVTAPPGNMYSLIKAIRDAIIGAFGAAGTSLLTIIIGPQPSTASTETEGQAFKTNASITVPVLIAAAASKWTQVTFIGNKSHATPNSGVVSIGPASADAGNTITLYPGDVYIHNAAPGKFIDLNTWYLDPAVANDGVGFLGVA